MPDLLAGAAWECAGTVPGEAAVPDDLDGLPLRWTPATVPGTVAGAWDAAGRALPTTAELDGADWWYRCTVEHPAGTGSATLELAGLASVAEVFVDGVEVARSVNMFRATRARVTLAEGRTDVAICFRALAPLLAVRRPRPRWRTGLATHQNLRWFRTTLLGRQPGWTVTPAPVGPWRPVTLVTSPCPRLVGLRTECVGGGGRVHVELADVDADGGDGRAWVEAAGVRAGLVAAPGGRRRATLVLDEVDRWWPHTHGGQPRTEVVLGWGGEEHLLGRVGFRTVEADRSGGGFTLVWNGTPIFARGAAWFPVDPVGLVDDPGEVRATLELARDAGCNLVRVPGGTVYASDTVADLCDELGIAVWHDCMLGYLDPPDGDDFAAEVVAEVTEQFGPRGGHPCLAVVCGGQELEEQAAMFGLEAGRRRIPLVSSTLPGTVAGLLPGVPYLPSSPTGGDPPFRSDEGVCHYFGIGTYRRPPDDARRAAPRFVSEGLAFAVPPEPPTVDRWFGGPAAAGHDPAWKAAVHHDTGRAWDLEDVRDEYVARRFGVEPRAARFADAGRALDLARATVAELMAGAAAEWRRPGSPCAGTLLVCLRDLRPGAGWGVIDATGLPKAPYYALARVWAPVSVVVTDEGVNGLRLHVVCDRPEGVEGLLHLELYGEAPEPLEAMAVPVSLRAGGSVTVEPVTLLGRFADLTGAHRFGPVPYPTMAVRLTGPQGRTVFEDVVALDEPGWVPEPDVGLAAAAPAGGGAGEIEVSTIRAARWVAIEVPGYVPSDSWFHLPPGGRRTVRVRPLGARGGAGAPPALRGRVRALNARRSAPVVVEAKKTTNGP